MTEHAPNRPPLNKPTPSRKSQKKKIAENKDELAAAMRMSGVLRPQVKK